MDTAKEMERILDEAKAKLAQILGQEPKVGWLIKDPGDTVQPYRGDGTHWGKRDASKPFLDRAVAFEALADWRRYLGDGSLKLVRVKVK